MKEVQSHEDSPLTVPELLMEGPGLDPDVATEARLLHTPGDPAC